ncbi:hypothetical protein [Actinopolymorpha pittospori]
MTTTGPNPDRRPLPRRPDAGDTQRLVELPKLGLAITKDVPTEVTDAYQRLRDAGFTSRLCATPRGALDAA